LPLTHICCKFKVLNGLHGREDKVRPIVGLLPAGSTNTVVLTVMRNPNFASAVLNIILGRKTYLDQGLIERDGRPNFYFSNFVGFGFFGDVVEHSERYRWLGPARYNFSGTVFLLKNRSYVLTLCSDMNDRGHPSAINLTCLSSAIPCVGCCRKIWP
jgi:ceramide kinase